MRSARCWTGERCCSGRLSTRPWPTRSSPSCSTSRAEQPGEPVRLLINSPGGEVYAGLAIHDVLRDVTAPVHTVCCGIAMSIASVILAAGQSGHRASFPNGRILIHQPTGGFQGQSSDVAIQAREAIWIRDHIEDIYARDTGRTHAQLRSDMNRDRFFSPGEAQAYGLIDRVLG